MKKFLVVLSALVCIWGLSVSSMAYQSKSVAEIPFIEKVGDVYKFSEVLLASKFTESQLEKWKAMCLLLQSGGTDDKFVVVMVDPNGGNYSSGSIDFIVVDGSFYIETSPWGSSICANKGKFEDLSFSLTDTAHSSDGSMICHYGTYSSLRIFSPRYILRGAAKLNSISPLVDDVFVIEDADHFLFEDDLGTFNVEPEEPDPSSSSSPAWIPPVVSDPVIPEGDEYVFYDTKILGLFLNHIRTQIVHAANVGWLIFGFILVWHVVKRVIKAFSSR